MKKDINKLLDEIFEVLRINDLKVDINTVLKEVRKSYHKKCSGEGLPDCAGCRAHRLYQDLIWFKRLL